MCGQGVAGFWRQTNIDAGGSPLSSACPVYGQGCSFDSQLGLTGCEVHMERGGGGEPALLFQSLVSRRSDKASVPPMFFKGSHDKHGLVKLSLVLSSHRSAGGRVQYIRRRTQSN